jgi:tetratricopeptide (TPR) repeat protein
MYRAAAATMAVSKCPCGSGLTPANCCSLQKLEILPPATLEKFAAQAQAAVQALERGNAAEAERQSLAILNQAPSHVDALGVLYKIRNAAGNKPAAEALLTRLVKINPNILWATNDLAMMLFLKGDRTTAEVHARNAVRLSPTNAQAHNMMGMIFTETNRNLQGEFHYRKALKLANPVGKLCANMALNLKQQGKLEESEKFYREAMRLEPENLQSLLGWIRMEESRREIKRAWELLSTAERLDPNNPEVILLRAVLYGRTKEYDKALAELARIDKGGPNFKPGAGLLIEKGQLLDKMGRYDEAFEAFREANRMVREDAGQKYNQAYASQLVQRLRGFFTRSRLNLLPRAAVRTDMAQPLFIVGFPRSGTTMVEQTLSSHPNICAGDELTYINDLTFLMPRMLGSPLTYPEALADLWMGDNHESLDNLRDFYLQRTRQLGIIREGAHWFTDKMPLNETHLGLVSLVFPQSPIIHLIRHPLDVIFSCFSNYLTHGFNCSFDVVTAATHYALIMDLVEHYRENLQMHYMQVKYEDIVADQEKQVRRMLEFVREPFDDRCLSFHENYRYARTASYAQVTEKLYDRSVYRYRNYKKQLEPAFAILEPAIKRLGYTID